jgi:hypothetical protein
LASPLSLGVTDFLGSVDFTLAFAVVHELPDADRFFAKVAQASKPGAGLLLVERGRQNSRPNWRLRPEPASLWRAIRLFAGAMLRY